MGNHESHHQEEEEVVHHKVVAHEGRVHKFTDVDPELHNQATVEVTTIIPTVGTKEKIITKHAPAPHHSTLIGTAAPIIERTTLTEKPRTIETIETHSTEIKTGTTAAPVQAIANTYATNVATVHVVDEGAHIKEIVEKEEVVQETVHKVEVEEIQPVVHREIKKTEVHEITQPIYETVEKPTVEIDRTNDAIVKETIDNRKELELNFPGAEISTVEHDAVKKMVITKPAIIEEEVTTEIIEIIQPVIHRETHQKIIVHSSQDIYEKYNEQATVVHETRAPVALAPELLETITSTTTTFDKSVYGKTVESETHIAKASEVVPIALAQ